MHPKIPNFEQQKNIESPERQELTPEQKKALGEVWTKVVIDTTDLPKNIGEMTHEELKNWLFKSIMKDTENFTNEMDLQSDQKFIEQIQNTADLKKKSELELKYIQDINSKIDKITQNFYKSPEKSTRWDSWPKRIKQTKEFNCVGATLCGMNLLNKAGIKSYFGNPHGHVVNIAKLSNGEWLYMDLRNGKENLVKIEPREEPLASVNVLKINHPNIDYKLVPIYENTEATESILGNLSCLKTEATDPNIPDENIEKKEAKEILEQNKFDLTKTDFPMLQQALYPKFKEVEETKEIQEEHNRIMMLRESERLVQGFIKDLSKEQRKTLVEEIRVNRDAIENLFYKEDETILSEISLNLKKILLLIIESKEKQTNGSEETINRIINRIKNL